MATFKNLQDDAMERLNLTSTDARTRVKRHINEWYRRIVSDLGLDKGRISSTTATTTTAALALTAQKVVGMRNQTTDLKMEQRSLDWIRNADPGDSTTGNPEVYAVKSQTSTTINVVLYPIPAASTTFDVDYVAAVTEMSGDSDTPTLVPEDYHWLLSLGARLNEYEKMDDRRWEVLRADLEAGIRKLRYFLRKAHDHSLYQGQTYESRASRLGGWYTE